MNCSKEASVSAPILKVGICHESSHGQRRISSGLRKSCRSAPLGLRRDSRRTEETRSGRTHRTRRRVCRPSASRQIDIRAAELRHRSSYPPCYSTGGSTHHSLSSMMAGVRAAMNHHGPSDLIMAVQNSSLRQKFRNMSGRRSACSIRRQGPPSLHRTSAHPPLC